MAKNTGFNMNTPFEIHLNTKEGWIQFDVGSQGITLTCDAITGTCTEFTISRKELRDLADMARYVWDNCNAITKAAEEAKEIEETPSCV
jgi:hypothetical protein